MKRKLLVLGESYMNLEIQTDPIGKNSVITRGGQYGFHPYGRTAATAITASKMGATCVLSSKLAKDSNGDRLKKYYNSCGVDTSLISDVEDTQTGFSVTMYEQRGNCSHIVSKGANEFFTKKDIDNAFGAFPDFFVVPQDNLSCADEAEEEAVKPTEKAETVDEILSNSLDMRQSDSKPIPESISDVDEPADTVQVSDPRGLNPLTLYACNKAMERGVDMIVDYDSCSSLPLSEFVGIKVLIISDKALYKMTGFYSSTDEIITRSLVSLQTHIRAKYYIVTVGSDASFVYDGNAYEKVVAPECMSEYIKDAPKRMRETFIGAFAAEFLETKNPVRACLYANIVSLMTKSNDGVLEHIPTKDEVEKYIADNKINMIRW